MTVPKINSAHGSDTRNIINRAIEVLNKQGKAMQDLVAEGQLTDEQYAELLTTINGLVKSGHVDKSVLTSEFKDEIEGISAKLAQKANQVEVGNTLEQKRDKSVPISSLDVSDELLTMFSPAGTINPVIVDESVNHQKTTFLKPKKNLFNKATRTINYYVSSADGQLKDNVSGFDASDFMLVDGGQAYTSSHGGQWAEYDASKNFITGHASSVTTAVLNSETRYVRRSIQQDNVDLFQFEKGEISTEYESFELVFKTSASEPIKIIGDRDVTPEKTSFMKGVAGKNKFPPNAVVIIPNRIPSATAVTSGTGGTSFLLPCEPNKSHTISRQVVGTRFRAAYTDTSQLVTGSTPTYNHTANDAGTSITLPPNPDARFIFCYFWRDADQGAFTQEGMESIKIQVEEGEEATSYEPFTKGFKIESKYLPTTSNSDEQPAIEGIVSILSDSFSAYEGFIPEGNRTRYPQSNLLTDVNQMWWKRLLNDTGLMLGVNESWAGSRVSWDGTTEGQDIGAHKHMASDARINNLGNNGTPDVIFFLGLTNDITANVPIGDFDGNDLTSLKVDTIANAYSTAIIKMQTRYPNAKIFCLSPIYRTYNNGQSLNGRLDSYIEMMREITDFFGVHLVDLRKCGITTFNADSYLPDGIHPNTSGMNLMAKYILNTVRTYLD